MELNWFSQGYPVLVYHGVLAGN
uniref:Uncharacterized protein n=1 Tax=Arundo donax TaxID=35708 RepID=A0A0A9AGW3_ARUDO